MLQFAQINTIGTATLTITAFNYLPYIGSIDVIPATGPYVVLETYEVVDAEGNNNGSPDYDESVKLTVEMKNVGIEDATDVMITLSAEDPYVIVTDYSELYPVIPAEGSLAIENGFALSIASDVPDQYAVTFNLSSTSGDETWTSVFIMTINAPILHINSMTIDDAEAGNGDGELDAGERADLTIDYSNTGHAEAYDVDVYLEGRSGFAEVTNPIQNFTSIGAFGTFTKTFTVIMDEEVPEGIKIDFANELTMGDLFQDRIFPLKVSALCEDFETGDFDQFNWQLGGNIPWQIINAYPYEGIFSIKSGAITHNQTSEISLSFNVMAADSIVFFRKVSSESSDMLKFYINNSLIEDWSGTTGGWKREAFAVSAGQKTFKWVYAKNNIGSGGSDCAWLDYIILPSPMALTIWAGPDDKACIGNPFQVENSYGTDYNIIQWASSGTGSFDDNTNMQPLYSPSSEDIESGEVMLTLTLTDDQGATIDDYMVLGFKDIPSIPGIPQGPVYVDLSEIQVSEYIIDELEEAEDYIWQLEPAGAGMIIADNNEVTVSWNNDFEGTAYISVAAANECGEGEYSETLAVEVENALVGIPDNGNTGFTVSIYPNPATDILNIKITGINEGEVELKIVDVVGKEQRLGSRLINLESFQPGMYFLVAESQGYRVIQKLIIK
jgi:hypothetical protein